MTTTRYKWPAGTRDVVGTLTSAQVAELVSEGISPSLLARYHCTRGDEQHVGEYTADEVATQFADWAVRKLADGEDIQGAPPSASQDPVIVSKLALRRALREAGLEPMFDAALAANPQAAADWADATSLRSDDPMLVAMLPVIASAAGLTAEQAEALLVSAAEAGA